MMRHPAVKSAQDKFKSQDSKVELYLKQSLNQIRNTDILTPELKSMLHDNPTTRVDQSRAFSIEERFVGTIPNSAGLLNHVKCCESQWKKDKKRYLSPYFSIVGPSGVGKSFAVKQLAIQHNLYVVYISFGSSHNLGYPLRSLVADSYGLSKSLTRYEMEVVWKKGLSMQIVLARRARLMGISPRHFWELQTEEKFYGFQAKLEKFISKQVSSDHCVTSVLETKCDAFLREFAQSLSDVKSQDLVIIAIDEARGLFSHSDSSQNIPFRAFRTALSTLSSQFSLFALLLDTTLQVANFSPPAVFDSSQKGVQDEVKELFPPFYQFYTYRIFCPQEIDLQAPDVLPTTVAAYGHPVFGAHLQKDYSLEYIFCLAKQKLNPCVLRPSGINNPTALLSEVRYLALLLHIVHFDVMHSEYSTRMVSGWMHPLCGISSKRDKIYLGQPISPLLSLASLSHLTSSSSVLEEALQDLSCQLGWGYVSSGDIGEVVASLGLVLSTKMTDGLEGIVPITLHSFIGNFLSPAVADKLTSSSMVNRGMVFFNRVIRFQAFRKSRYPTPSDLLYLYASCSACFLPTGAPGADILVPVWIPPTSTAPARMGCLLVQVKNREKHTLGRRVVLEAQDSIGKAIAAMGISKKRTPVLGIMVCMRVAPGGRSGSMVIPGNSQRLVKTNLRARSSRNRASGIPICLAVGFNPSDFSFLQAYSARVREEMLGLLSLRTNCNFVETPYCRYVYETSGQVLEP